MKNSNLIAIGGLKGAGKNESASMLQYCLSVPKIFRRYWLYRLLKDKLAYKYLITSFASALKESLAAIIGISPENFEDRNFKENTYIFFPSLTITDNPPKDRILPDSKFVKKLSSNLDFIKEYYLTMRQALQMYGTELIKNVFGEDFWVHRTLQTESPLIISDLRFINEYNYIKSLNGYVIYIDRGGIPGNHRSEKEVISLLEENKFDFVIENKSSKKDLFKKIIIFCSENLDN